MSKKKRPCYSRAISKVNNDMHKALDEIIRANALRFLPAKSLCRFKAVSKDWESVISNPIFEHSQSYSARSLSGLFGQSPEGSIFFISPNPKAYGVPDPKMQFLPEPVDLIASANGLLCCRGHTGDKPYYICNPANRQWQRLPNPEADHGLNPTLVLVYEPLMLSFQANYRLICAFPSVTARNAYEFEIYSSADNLWKTSSEICFGKHPRVLDPRGIHLNGLVYWLTSDKFILAFDWMMHSAKLIPCCTSKFGTDTLGVVDGKPCFSHRLDTILIMYVVSNVGGNTAQMLLNCKQRKTGIKVVLDGLQNVLTVGSDLIVFHDGRKIHSYNMRTGKAKRFGNRSNYDRNCFYVPYVNSLVNLGKQGQVDFVCKC